MDKEKRTRTINGVHNETWQQFGYWAKRLGHNQGDFLELLMKFYFEGNKEELALKLGGLQVTVTTKGAKETSPLLKADLERINAEIETMGVKELRQMSNKLANVYISNKLYSYEDRMRAEAAIVQLDKMAKQKESG
jgi:hypothetical protein